MENQNKKIKRIVGENWNKLNPLIFVGPPIFTLIVAAFLLNDRMGHMGYIKNTMEIAPFFLLLPAALIAFIRLCAERNLFFLWLIGCIAVIICREIHWDWTSVGIYLMLLLLLLAGFVFFDNLKPYIASAAFINVMATVLSFYFISEMLLDHNWIRIPKNFGQEISFRSSLEECTEMSGHIVLAFSVLLIHRDQPR